MGAAVMAFLVCTRMHTREIKEGQKDSQGKMGNVTSEERGDCRAQQILKGN